jgi:hypothetical protein
MDEMVHFDRRRSLGGARPREYNVSAASSVRKVPRRRPGGNRQVGSRVDLGQNRIEERKARVV